MLKEPRPRKGRIECHPVSHQATVPW